MSTSATPTTPTAHAAPAAPSTLQTKLSYFYHHILLLVIVVGLAAGMVYKFEGLLEKHDLAQEAKYNSLLAAQAQQTAALETQLTAQEAHWQQIEQTLLAQNASLTKTIANQNQQTSSQVKNDATLSAQQAAARLTQQTGANSGEIVASNNTVVLDLPVSRNIAASLDLLAGAQADLLSTQTQLNNETTIATNLQTQTTQQTAIIAGLQKQNVEQVAACTAEVAAIKKANTKSKIKAFFIGVGTVLLGVVGHAI